MKKFAFFFALTLAALLPDLAKANGVRVRAHVGVGAGCGSLALNQSCGIAVQQVAVQQVAVQSYAVQQVAFAQVQAFAVQPYAVGFVRQRTFFGGFGRAAFIGHGARVRVRHR